MRIDKKDNLVREIISSPEGQTFGYKRENEIWPVWHYHPEIDILLFLKDTGQHITGDYIGSFGPETLLMNGPNVPHSFTTNSPEAEKGSKAALIVLQFSEHSLGQALLSKSDLVLIREFLQSAARSYEFFGNTRARASKIVKDLGKCKGPQRFIQFIMLLETLALAPDHEKKSLVSEFYAPVLTEKNINRIEVVRSWLLNNLTEQITLQNAADQINMTPKSFSYFFKKNTGKPFVQYVKELRIGMACQKLLAGNLSILEICYASGFNNLSNFNRQFLQTKGMQPSQFRKEFNSITVTEA